MVESFEDVPPTVRTQLGQTGELSVDIFQAPALVQSWVVLDRIRQLAEEAGGTMDDVFKLVQYSMDLRDYPLYSGVRAVLSRFAAGLHGGGSQRMLPSRSVRIEVEATAYIPLDRRKG